MATKLSQEELLAQFETLTLIELSEFVKAFEDEFDVTLTGAGEKKIQVIKVVRELTSLGLKEAKDLVDGAPKPVLEKVAKEAADKAVDALKAAGAGVEVLWPCRRQGHKTPLRQSHALSCVVPLPRG